MAKSVKKKTPLRKSINVDICGETWRVNLMPRRSYEAKRDKTSEATTDSKTREIDFISEYFCHATVIHEVFHAFHVYLHLESTDNITRIDHEEIIAELLERRIYDIIRISTYIFRMITKKAIK